MIYTLLLDLFNVKHHNKAKNLSIFMYTIKIILIISIFLP